MFTAENDISRFTTTVNSVLVAITLVSGWLVLLLTILPTALSWPHYLA